MTVALQELVDFLDTLLRVHEVPDDPAALNGLQVECRRPIARVVAAVDASQATIDRAIAESKDPSGTTLILVHHGLFWDGNVPVVGRRYRRLKALIESDVALYSAHIPLDLHPDFGNNVLLAKRLGLELQCGFGAYKGVEIGVRGRLAKPTRRSELAQRLAAAVGTSADQIITIPGGPELCDKVGIITGAASRQIFEAAELGLDTFISGEGPHHSYFDAIESGINVLYGGHYATETLGVDALARHLGERFGLAATFHDHPTGL